MKFGNVFTNFDMKYMDPHFIFGPPSISKPILPTNIVFQSYFAWFCQLIKKEREIWPSTNNFQLLWFFLSGLHSLSSLRQVLTETGADKRNLVDFDWIYFCCSETNVFSDLTLSPLLTAIVPYVNSMYPDETPSNCVSTGSKLFDTQTTFSPTLRDIDAYWKLKQTGNRADSN